MSVRPTRSSIRSASGPKRLGGWGAAALALATSFALVACSASPAGSTAPSAVPASEAPASASAAPESAAPSASASAPASVEPSPSAAAVQDLAVTGTEYAFEAPASIPAGITKITLTNAGKEEHQAQVAGIAAGKTLEDLTTALQGGDENAALAMLTLSGGPTGVVPGASVATTSDLKPGQYVFLCFVPSPDGVPHIAKGMIAPIEVTEPASTAELPSGDAELVLQDFAFVGLETLTAGEHTVTVTNDGPQPHEATVVKLPEGMTASDLVPVFTSTEPQTGAPPFTSVAGVAGIASGATVTMDLDLEPGNYAFLCFVPDPATGRPHVALGMVGALTVE
jgi:plastocyanin